MSRRHVGQAWDHTASLLVILANANRDPKKRFRPYGLADFHPDMTSAPRGMPVNAETLELAGKSFGCKTTRKVRARDIVVSD